MELVLTKFGTAASYYALPIIDECGLIAIAGGAVPSARFSVVLDSVRSILVSCGLYASLVTVQQQAASSISLVVRNSTITVMSLTTTPRSNFLQMNTGSFILSLINAALVSSSFVFENCSIQCGVICQVFSVAWLNPSGFVSTFSTTALSSPTRPHVVTSPWMSDGAVSIVSCSLSIPRSSSSTNQRSVFSVGNTSNVTFVIVGPLMLGAGFRGLMFTGGYGLDELSWGPRPPVPNQVLLVNCDTIRSATLDKLMNMIGPQGLESMLRVRTIRADRLGGCHMTESRSMSRTTSTTEETRTIGPLTHTTSYNTYRPVQPLPSAKLAVSSTSTLTLALCVPVAGIDPMAGSQMQQAVLVAVLAGCGSDVEGQPLPRAWSLLQLRVGDDLRTAYVIGGALGNVVVMLIVTMLAGSVVALTALKMRKKRPGARFSDLLFRVAAKRNMPGWLIMPTKLLLQPTISCAWASIACGSAAGVVCGVIALSMFLLLALGPVVLVLKVERRLVSAMRMDALKSPFVMFVMGPKLWTSLNGLKPVKVRHIIRLVGRYRCETPWFIAADVGGALALGICGGVQLSHHGCLPSVSLAVCVILTCATVGRLTARPYSSRLRNTCTCLSDLLCTTAMFLAVNNHPEATGVLATAAVLVMGGLQVSVIIAAALTGHLSSLFGSKGKARGGPSDVNESPRPMNELVVPVPLCMGLEFKNRDEALIFLITMACSAGREQTPNMK